MEVPRIRSHTPDVHHCQACGAARSSAKGACAFAEMLNKLDKKLVTAKFGGLGQSGQLSGIPPYTTERDHETPLGAVLELVGRLF